MGNFGKNSQCCYPAMQFLSEQNVKSSSSQKQQQLETTQNNGSYKYVWKKK